ncbi:hypothetical protein B0H13DRAFT_1850563 [Mycena leptocephala]|nr:hypothetical protein B0H13DRAFT_1850563 [Mycena leptocephala]
MWGKAHTFPLPASVDIELRDGFGMAFRDVIGLFVTTPCLRTVKILPNNVTATPWVSAFTWSTLTELNIQLNLVSPAGRDILIQSPQLQKCGISLLCDPRDSSPIKYQEICRLNHLDVEFELDAQPSNFFGYIKGLALPNLTRLSIQSITWWRNILPDLYTRSGFNLQALNIHALHLADFDVSFLRLLPSLHTLHLECFGFGDGLFAHFTFDPIVTSPSLTLPNLRSLTFFVDAAAFPDDNTCPHPSAVINFAKSISRPTGENPAFLY